MPVREGQLISVRVKTLNLVDHTCTATCAGKELQRAEYMTLAQERAKAAAEEAAERSGGPVLSRGEFVKRRVGHPQFKNGTREQVRAFLAAMPVGETVFRPSSRADHLTATVKLTAHGPLLHVDILEKDKPSPAELGASLWIGRVESDASKQGDRFDDLDEILYRYVEPLVENMREVTGHRKFAPELSAEAVVERLNREKANSDMIAYALALYEKDATTVVIYVVRAEGRKHREAIKVSPAGFVYRDVAFNTLEEAIKHFKVEASELESY